MSHRGKEHRSHFVGGRFKIFDLCDIIEEDNDLGAIVD